MRKAIFILLLLFVLIWQDAYTEESPYLYCEGPHTIFYNNDTSKIYLGCAWFNYNPSEISIINPSSLESEKEITLTNLYGRPEIITPIENGEYILVLQSACDGIERNTDGKLIKIDFDTEIITNVLNFNLWPLAMAIDCNEEFAFVTSYSGSFTAPGKLTKVDLNSFSVVREKDYGVQALDIEITPDGLKIYIADKGVYRRSDPEHYYWQVGVFSTDNYLTPLEPIPLQALSTILVMAPDGRLFITHDHQVDENNPFMIVYDTWENRIINTFNNFGDVRLWLGAVDPSCEKIYYTTWLKTAYDEEVDAYYHEPSNMILEMDLSNYSWRMIQLDNDPLWDIAVASVNGNNRIFCTEFEGADIHYIDIQ